MQEKIIAVVSSDWHIALGAWKYRGIRGDAYCSLDQIVDTAISHSAALIAAGDLYDEDDPDPTSVRRVSDNLDRLKEAGSKFLFNAGQHDAHRHGRWLSVHTWPTHLEADVPHVIGDGVTVWGFDWVPPDSLPDKLAAIPRELDLLVMHQVWAEFMGESLGVAEGKLADVPGDMTIVTGDYHKLSGVIQAGAHRVLSPGSICLQALDEPPDKFCWLLGESGEFYKSQLKTRRVAQFIVYNDDALAQLVAQAPAILESLTPAGHPPEIATPIIAIDYPHVLHRVGPAVKGAFGDSAHLFFQPQTPKAEAKPVRQGKVVVRGGLVDNLASVFPPGTPNYNRLYRLLETRNGVDAELQALEAAYFAEFSAA